MFMYVAPLLSLSLLLLFGSFASGAPLNITSASDFIAFSNAVLAGTNYAGATVFLENDIDFSGSSSQFKPIGNESSYFRGVFDGQGHKISNLAFSSGSFRHAGLFGYSMGLTIRNLVIDSTCSFSSSANTDEKNNTFIAGLIGCCDALDGACISENIVNMASVSYSGNSGWNTFLGGISGQFYCEEDYEVAIRNCINYGAVTFKGHSEQFSQIGGIAAEVCSPKETPATMLVQNCINYGPITYSGTDTYGVLMGGVVGVTIKVPKIENCVNVGVIANTTSIPDTFIGGIVGNVCSDIEFINCFWAEETGYAKLYGDKNDTAVVTQTDSSQISDYSETASTLNKYNTTWNRWAYNANRASITFNINRGTGFTFTSSKLILLPSLVENSGPTFSGWYTDSSCTNTFTSATISTSGSMSLYSGWVYTLTYNGNGGTPSQPSKSVVYGQLYGTLSDATRDGYTFLGWYTTSSGDTKVEANTRVTNAYSHTLYAHWFINNYTVIFNIDNITIIEEEYQFNEEIKHPTNIPEMEGYMFIGWDKDITKMPDHNITINAVWSKVTEYVEIVFGTKDLTEKGVEEIIKKYAGSNSDFTIIGFENKSEGTKVIIKFTEAKEAKNFVEIIKSDTDIKSVGFVSDDAYSLSSILYSAPLFYTIFSL